MTYNPHDDEMGAKDREPDILYPDPNFNFNRGKPNTRLRKAQDYNDTFALMGGLFILPLLISIFGVMLIMFGGRIEWWTILMVIICPVYYAYWIQLEKKINRLGFHYRVPYHSD